MSKLPTDPSKFVDAIAALAKKRKRDDLLGILDAAKSEFTFLDEDWGVTYFRLQLTVPWSTFDSVPDLESIEETLSNLATDASKGLIDEKCRQVMLAHEFDAPSDWRTGLPRVSVSDREADRIWRHPGHFRLFLSHRSEIKREVHELAQALSRRCIDAFVAHDHIEPSREWQKEIELALASCHGLAALASEGFHESVWCMQEVGWALGRGILVLPVMLPHDPRGFPVDFRAFMERSRN